jgi:hypothetical protein
LREEKTSRLSLVVDFFGSFFDQAKNEQRLFETIWFYWLSGINIKHVKKKISWLIFLVRFLIKQKMNKVKLKREALTGKRNTL